MRPIRGQSLIWGMCFIAGLMGPTKFSRAANCALFARAETGVALYGAAGGWWDEAEGRYERGHAPVLGAILVFKPTRQIPSGHVAVVARIISAREILVDQANWYHGTVSRGMSVIDTSPGHDWTTVAVINPPSGTHGSDYPTYGFVYPGTGPGQIIESRAEAGLDSGNKSESARAGLLHFAAATEDWQDMGHEAAPAPRDHQLKRTASHTSHKAPSNSHSSPIARTKLRAPVHVVHTGKPRLPTHPIKTADAKHHRA